MKQWEIKSKLKAENANLKTDELIEILLQNRGIKTKKEQETFLHPKLEDVTPKAVEINLTHLKKTIARIKKAIENEEHIVVYGDYDVDGITGTAILWETLYKLGANVTPYIPHRVDEGYGLSIVGITNLLTEKPIDLIITVDNGIVAHDAVEFANKQNIQVIITDHHAGGDKAPEAFTIVHTTKLCGAGVAYLLSKELKNVIVSGATCPPVPGDCRREQSPDGIAASSTTPRNDDDNHLELATLGTIADLVPLTDANRAIVTHGLAKVTHTKRPGLRALFQQAKITKDAIGTYEIGYLIGPRLNAAGRLESGMDSLRLLCTTSKARATELAEKLELINRERQQLMKDSAEHAILSVTAQSGEMKSILIVHHESYQEGVIGLIAGKLVEAFYRPAIVIAKREKHSKASVRSIKGFNIIEFLRNHSDFFVNVGGHPMAAGFTVETEKLLSLQETLEKNAALILTEEMLQRILKIDCVLPLSAVTKKMYAAIQSLAPFGMGNAESVFASREVIVDDFRVLGREGNHLRLQLRQGKTSLEAIAFGMGELAQTLSVGDKIDIAYSIDENTWNGNTKLQLKVKDLKLLA